MLLFNQNISFKVAKRIQDIFPGVKHLSELRLENAKDIDIWKTIVMEEKKGNERADYGKAIIKNISKELTAEFGNGFSVRNIFYFRQFYLTFPKYEMLQTLPAKLSWSHFQLIMNVSSKEAQKY
jgi:hypothetical protein